MAWLASHEATLTDWATVFVGLVDAYLARRTDEVAVLEVEAVELVASRFCVHYVFINDEGGALAMVGDTLADLAAEALVIRVNRKSPYA